MSETIYAVGSQIQLCEFGFFPHWIFRTSITQMVTEIPCVKDFDNRTLIDSLTSSDNILYFLNEENALKYARKNAIISDHDCNILYCFSSIVFKVSVELTNKANEFKITDILTANIITEDNSVICQELNYNVTSNNSSIFSFFQTNNQLTCNAKNYQDDFSELLRINADKNLYEIHNIMSP